MTAGSAAGSSRTGCWPPRQSCRRPVRSSWHRNGLVRANLEIVEGQGQPGLVSLEGVQVHRHPDHIGAVGLRLAVEQDPLVVAGVEAQVPGLLQGGLSRRTGIDAGHQVPDAVRGVGVPVLELVLLGVQVLLGAREGRSFSQSSKPL